MSAYVVDKETVNYLVTMALKVAVANQQGENFRYIHDGQIKRLDRQNRQQVGQMLWDQNVKSVSYRYNETNPKELPCRTEDAEEGFQYSHNNLLFAGNSPEPAQIFSALNCYDYQSCEDPGWNDSEAKAFVESLKNETIRLVPGYEKAEWGHPKPQPPIGIMLSDLYR